MRRTRTRGILYEVYGYRAQASEVLGAVARRNGTSSSVAGIAVKLHEAAAILGGGTVARRYEQFACLCDSLVNLLRWADAIRSAEVDADRYLRAAKQHAKDIGHELSSDAEAARLSEAASRITTISDVSEIKQVAEFLLHTPLPLPLFVEETGPRLPFETEPTQVAKPQVTVALISFALNDVAFGDPQTIEPNILHDLAIEIRLSRWPDSAEELVLDVVSVEPRDVYELPRFKFNRPKGMPPYILQQRAACFCGYRRRS